MNKKDSITKETANWHKYHVPGMGNYTTRAKNAVFISAANSIEHETVKLKICYSLRKEGHVFITEAVENTPKGGEIIRRDIVDITAGVVIEIETDLKARKVHEQVNRFGHEVEWVFI